MQGYAYELKILLISFEEEIAIILGGACADDGNEGIWSLNPRSRVQPYTTNPEGTASMNGIVLCTPPTTALAMHPLKRLPNLSIIELWSLYMYYIQ